MPRVTATLATVISLDQTRAIGLEYRDPDSIDVAAFEGDGETLVVPKAGEIRFRLETDRPPLAG